MPNTPIARTVGFGRAIDDETVSLGAGSASSLNPPAGTQFALVSCVTGTPGIRWRVSGNDPTSSVGHPMSEGQYFEFFGDDIKAARFISQSGSASIFVTYFS